MLYPIFKKGTMTEILTINELRVAIDNDSTNYRIKDLAELLWTAMNDWPTQNQVNTKQFKSYHYKHKQR